MSTPGPANSQGLALVTLPGLSAALYVSDPAANAIRVYSISQSSNLPSPAAFGPYPLGGGNGAPGAMYYGGGGDLYVATSADRIAAFSPGPDGELTPVPGSPFIAGAGVSQLVEAFLPTPPPAANTECLFGSDSTDPNGGVSAFAVQNNGALAPIAGSPFATVAEAKPTALAVTGVSGTSGESDVLYVGLGDASAIAAFAIAPNCSLAPLPGSPFPAGNGVASLITEDNTLFAVNSTDGTISSFTINPTAGTLTPVATEPMNGVAGSGSVLNADGVIFLPNPINGSVLGLQLPESPLTNPKIAFLPGSPFPAASGALALAFLFRPHLDPP